MTVSKAASLCRWLIPVLHLQGYRDAVWVVYMVLLIHMDTDFLIQSLSEGLTRGFEIVPRLEVHPELRLHPKEAAQAQSCICRDPSFSMDNLVNTTRRHPDRLGQMVLADLHWRQKILK